MLEMSGKTANLLFGFKETDGEGYPCNWCGVLTTLMDAEHIAVCAEHQREEREIGFQAMMKKYPLACKDERNPDFFKAQDERRLARAKSLTREDLTLIIQRGLSYDRELAQEVLDGKTPVEHELLWLGIKAEEFIDNR